MRPYPEDNIGRALWHSEDLIERDGSPWLVSYWVMRAILEVLFLILDELKNMRKIEK
ncbi:MAG: hypothetical protein WA061_02690 [Microgenomates group bacterium]